LQPTFYAAGEHHRYLSQTQGVTLLKSLIKHDAEKKFQRFLPAGGFRYRQGV
jgi:hypothetical protein